METLRLNRLSPEKGSNLKEKKETFISYYSGQTRFQNGLGGSASGFL